MKIDWDQVSTDLSLEQAESAFEPIGRFILFHTQLDLLLGRVLVAVMGLSGNQPVDHLVQTIEAGNKKRTLDALSGIFGGDPHGIVQDYLPNPRLRTRLKSFSKGFEDASKVRNIIAHGTLGRYQNRVFVGSIAAPYFFKNTGGSESWVFIDEIDDRVQMMVATMELGKALRNDFNKAHERMNLDRVGNV